MIITITIIIFTIYLKYMYINQFILYFIPFQSTTKTLKIINSQFIVFCHDKYNNYDYEDSKYIYYNL